MSRGSSVASPAASLVGPVLFLSPYTSFGEYHSSMDEERKYYIHVGGPSTMSIHPNPMPCHVDMDG